MKNVILGLGILVSAVSGLLAFNTKASEPTGAEDVIRIFQYGV